LLVSIPPLEEARERAAKSPMFFLSKSRFRSASLTLVALLSQKVASAQQTAPASDETIAAPITVRASDSAAQSPNDEFLAGFISAAVQLEGPKFLACMMTAASLRPDLAGKIVICALNIARLNSYLPNGTLSFVAINQIIKTVVSAAPQSAADIVEKAIESEPYARASIIAAAVAAVPAEESEINTAATGTQVISFFASVSFNRFNPIENAEVNSPEQPPVGP
jgi:hypothetical protein